MKNFTKGVKKPTINNSNFKMILKIAISGHWANQNEKTTFENSSTLKITNEEICLLFWEKKRFFSFFEKSD